MNASCYKIVFSQRLGTLVAVGEHTASAGKAASGQACRSSSASHTSPDALAEGFVGVLRLAFASVALACLSLGSTQAQSAGSGLSPTALPQGGSINTGSTVIGVNGAQMVINQTTDKASINWQSFNVGTAASVNITQPSASSVLLNRVVGNDSSQILGKLTANGQLILLNPNGIVFGKDGSVTASTFTASTFGLTDTDFMDGFYKYKRNGSTAAVVNQGTIETSAGGFVALIGATVTNDGTIRAPQGDVILAAAENVTLPAGTNNGTVSVRMSKRVRLELDPAAINTAVNNTESGVIVTEGGQVLLQAAALSTAVASVTHSGSIDTSAPQAGAVTVLAEGGVIKVDGRITANSNGSTNGSANRGGDIIIGRDEETGALAKSTDASGALLSTSNGFIETSGEYLTTTGIQIKAKDWLLDPNNIEINATSAANTAGNSVVLASDIVNALSGGANVVISTGTAGSTNASATSTGSAVGITGTGTQGSGTIAVNTAIAGASNAVIAGSANSSLTLSAASNITVGAEINTAGDVFLQSSGGMIRNTSAISGRNISIDNTGGAINTATGGITAGTSASGASVNGVELKAAITASKNLNVYGASSGANGILSQANLAAAYINATGKSTTGSVAFAWNGGTISTTGTGGTSTASTVTGISNASTSASVGWAAFSMYSNSSATAANGTTLSLIGNAPTVAAGALVNQRGWRINSGVTLNTTGDISIIGSSSSSDGLLIGGTINNQASPSSKLTLQGTTSASSSAGLSGINISGGAINGGSSTGAIKLIGTANNTSTTTPDYAISFVSGASMTGGSASSVTLQSTIGTINLNTTSAISAASGNLIIQSSGNNISQAAGSLSAKNITIDNTGGSIDATTGAITKGTGAAGSSSTISGINLLGTVTATGNINMAGYTTATAAGMHGVNIGGATTTSGGYIDIQGGTSGSATATAASGVNIAAALTNTFADSTITLSGSGINNNGNNYAVLIGADVGGVSSTSNLVIRSLNGTQISHSAGTLKGKNISIDNTGGTVSAGIISAPGVLTMNGGAGVRLNSTGGINASSGLNIFGKSTVASGVLVQETLTAGSDINVVGTAGGAATTGAYIASGISTTSGNIFISGTNTNATSGNTGNGVAVLATITDTGTGGKVQITGATNGGAVGAAGSAISLGSSINAGTNDVLLQSTNGSSINQTTGTITARHVSIDATNGTVDATTGAITQGTATTSTTYGSPVKLASTSAVGINASGNVNVAGASAGSQNAVELNGTTTMNVGGTAIASSTGEIKATSASSVINVTGNKTVNNTAMLTTTTNGASINLTSTMGGITGSGSIGSSTYKGASVTFTSATTSTYDGAINETNFIKAGAGSLILDSWITMPYSTQTPAQTASLATNISNAYTVKDGGSLSLSPGATYAQLNPASVNVENASVFSISTAGNGWWKNTAFNFTGGNGGGTLNLGGNPIGASGTTTTFSTSGGATNKVTGLFNANNANINLNLVNATSGTALLDGSFAALAFIQNVQGGYGLQNATSINMSGGGGLLVKDKIGATNFNINAGQVQIGDGTAATTSTTATLEATNISIAAGAKLTFNRAEAYSNSSTITGAGNLVQAGAGTLTLTGNNNISGTTTVNASTLQIGNGGTTGSLGTGDVILNNNTNLKFVRAAATTITNNISGAGNVITDITGATGGDLTVAGNVSLTGANTVTLKASGDISVSASKSIATATGSVLLNSDSDASGSGAIVMNTGSSISTNGGNITLGGGSAGTGADFAIGNATNPNGVLLNGASLSSAGGDITLRGKSSADASYYDYRSDGVRLRDADANVNINSGTGKISITGISQTTYADSGNGVEIGTYGVPTYATTLTTSNSTASAINITGTGSSSNTPTNSNGVLLSAKASILSTNASGGTINLVGNGNKQGGVYTFVGARVLSAKGDINITGSATTDKLNSIALRGAKLGYDTTDITTSSANINLTSDAMAIETNSALKTTGTVNLVNKTAGTKIDIGGNDVAAATATLGLTNAELNTITASKLVIGSASAGDMTVSSVVTTSATSGDVSLLTGGNLSINAALTVGETGATKNLTINASGTSSVVTQSAALKATGLELLGSTAAYTLTNADNDIVTLAGNTQSLAYFDSNALNLGSVNTTGLTANGTVKIESDGDIAVTQAIHTNDTSAAAVVLNAGKSTTAGTATGGDITISGTGSVVTGTGGRITYETGSIAGSTGLGVIAGNHRYNSDEASTNYTVNLGSGAYAIYREKPLVTVDINNASKTYDSLAYSGGVLNTVLTSGALLNGDTFAAVTANVAFSGSSQGAKNASTTPYVISANDAGGLSSNLNALGYGVSYTSGALTIGKANLTIAAVTDTKTYDGGTGSSGTVVVTGKQGNDSVTASQSFASKNVLGSNDSTLFVDSVYTINDGNNGNNYTVSTTSAIGTITKKDLTISATVSDKIYDTTAVATAALSSNMISGDNLTLSKTDATFDTKNVGTGKTVTVAGLSISGTDAGNYNLTNTSTTTNAAITPAQLTVTATQVTKEYDGLTTAAGTGTVSTLAGDDAVNSTGGQMFTNKNAGLNNKIVQASGITLKDATGHDVTQNYNITYIDNTNSTITPASLIIKVNDTDMFVTQDARTALHQGFTYSTFKNGETAATALIGGALTAGDRSYTGSYFPTAGNYANVYGLATTPTSVNGNYAITVERGNLTVTPADKLLITVTSQSDTYGNRMSSNAAYANNNSVSAQYCLVANNCNGANLVSLTMTRLADNKWQATDNTGSYVVFDTTVATTSSSYSTGGYLKAGSYNLNTTEIAPLSLPNGNFSGRANNGGVLTITPLAIALSTNSINKTYDGNTGVTGVTIAATNTATGDSVNATASTGSFATKNVGNGIAVSLSDLGLSGVDASNYYLTSNTLISTGSITPKSLIPIYTAADKTYNANTTASVIGTSNDIINGDTVVLTNISADFDNKNAGNGKTVSIAGISISGADAGNYMLTSNHATTTGNITPKNLLASFTATDKIYNGNTIANVTGYSTDVMTGDTVTFTATSANFNNKNVGTAKTVFITGISLGGADGGNYALQSNTASTHANITTKNLTASFTASNKTFDGTTLASVTGTSSDLVAGDSVTFTNATANFDTKEMGTAKTVSVAGIAINGIDAANYSLQNSTSTATADITAASNTINPPKPIIPTESTHSANGGNGSGDNNSAQNPYLLIPSTPLNTDNCTSNNLDACTCEKQDSGIAICYQPQNG